MNAVTMIIPVIMKTALTTIVILKGDLCAGS